MRLNSAVVCWLALVCPGASLFAQPWAGILAPARAIDWSAAGIPGGIPSAAWTQAGATITASSGDRTSAIQTALNACGTSHYVLLGPGTFSVSSLNIPSNCELRGSGASQTILSGMGGPSLIVLGSTSPPAFASNTSISGASAGATMITVGSATGITAGSYLMITQVNSGAVKNSGTEGSCTWCDGGQASGTRSQGQIVEITSVNGTNIGISPPLYTSYANSPTAVGFAAASKYAGVANLQAYANKTGKPANFYMGRCAYCWISGVEGNYADGDHVEVDWSYRGIIQNSYFSNSYLHTPGTYDSCLVLRNKTSGMIVQNNIFERLHVSIMLEWGAAGNVIAYNYMETGFDTSATNVVIGGIDYHGAHPQFNLHEGNVAVQIYYDSVWGSSANNTDFRNWMKGSSALCSPLSAGRNSVTCSSKTYPFQGSRAFQVSQIATSDNFVGNVTGSSEQSNNVGYGGGTTKYNSGEAPMTDALRWPTSRVYDTTMYAWTFGYGEAADGGSGSGDSTNAWDTAFLHGNYGNISGALVWASGVTHTLPASFYLSAKPSWWGSLPYPAIGPDVTAGNGPGGHAYLTASNPAQNCYFSVMHGTAGGGGGPLPFDALMCYGASAATPTGPAAPTGVVATSQ